MKKNKFIINKTDFKYLAIILLLLLVFSYFCAAISLVYADEPAKTFDLNYDKTNLYYELLNSEDFDFKDYPIDEKNKQLVVQNFVEYCYSYDSNKRFNYGLYFYVYNPSLIEIDTKNFDNKAQLAVGYDREGKPNNYEKFDLVFCSKIENPDYLNLFYKFKLVDHRSTTDNKTFAERVNSNARRYDISGVELTTKGSTLAIEYPVKKTYIFSGYAKGYGPSSSNESTLKCKVEKLTTLDLKVEHTYYRTESSNKGADYQNQIDTVYFSVPKEYFENEGVLQRIKAEWYEYKTKPIVVTSHNDFYNEAINYIGEKITSDPLGELLDLDWYLLAYTFLGHKWHWNYSFSGSSIAAESLYYLLPCDDIKEYDPYHDYTNDGKSNALYDYILNYTKTYDKGTLPIKNGSISADLFESDIDDNRKVDNEFGQIKNGYSCYDFDADLDLKHLLTWQDTDPSFWDNWNKFDFWNALTGNIPQDKAITLKPIVEFDFKDIFLSDEKFVDKYYINAGDVAKFKLYASKAQLKGEKVILFRFATSDYYSTALSVFKQAKPFQSNEKEFKGQAYMCQESVFFNFDIIHLTFKNADKYTVIPVSSSPIDIVDEPTPPTHLGDKSLWDIILEALKWIGIAIAVCFGLWLLAVLFPIILAGLKLVFGAIKLPFKAIAGVCKKGKNKAVKMDKQSSPPKAKRGRKYSADEAKMAKDRFKPKKE